MFCRQHSHWIIQLATAAAFLLGESSAFAVDGPSARSAAQDAPATDCDTYAASPADPLRNTKGVPLERIDSTQAIPACQRAVRQYPNSSRLIFQLGRAYGKNRDFSSALI